MAKARRSKRKSKKSNTLSPFFRMTADAGVFCLTVLVGLAALFAYIASDLPDTGALWNDNAKPSVTLLAADGSPMSVRGARQGAPVRLAELPAYVPNAFLAVEDRNFYHHLGVNPISIVRAALVNLRQRGVVQGGSTITQQLAKNLFLGPDRTIKRKAQELLLALWLEQKFTKQEILTLYLNRVYFGGGAYGIDAASHRYFAKRARDINVGEAAVLAGLLKAPSRYAPTSNPTDAGKRGRLVIDQMKAAGFLTGTEAEIAIAQPVILAQAQYAAAPYFVDHAISETRKLVGAPDVDIIIRTTYDPKIQAAAELGLDAASAMSGAMLSGAQQAVIVMDSAGAVRALIGGRDYRDSQFNRATQAFRQPGSAFKPIVFLAAIEAGLGPDTRVVDGPVAVDNWAPDNYNDRYYGEVSLSDALAHSMNSATVRVQEYVGRKAVRQTARRLGWPGDLNAGPALALGVDSVSPMQLAGIYAPFVNGGYRIEPHVIQQIESVNGDVLYAKDDAYLEQAFTNSAIEKIDYMLRNVVLRGTGSAAGLPGYPVAGKTGTSQHNRDAWFSGYAGGLVCVVWVGNDDNKPIPGLTGGGPPAAIWREAMVRILPSVNFAPIQASPATTEMTMDDILSNTGIAQD